MAHTTLGRQAATRRLRVRERRQRALCRFRGAVRAVWLAQRLMVQAQGPEMAGLPVLVPQ